jgi:hypothetical protein
MRLIDRLIESPWSTTPTGRVGRASPSSGASPPRSPISSRECGDRHGRKIPKRVSFLEARLSQPKHAAPDVAGASESAWLTSCIVVAGSQRWCGARRAVLCGNGGARESSPVPRNSLHDLPATHPPPAAGPTTPGTAGLPAAEAPGATTTPPTTAAEVRTAVPITATFASP